MTGQQREFAVGDRVTHRHRGGGESTGRVLSVVYRVEWDDPHIPDSSCRGGDLRPVIDPAELAYVADLAKYDPPSAVDLEGALEDSIARGREAQREAGLRLDGPEVA